MEHGKLSHYPGKVRLYYSFEICEKVDLLSNST